MNSANTAPKSFGNFELIKQVKLSYTDVSVLKYRSRVTGLTVVHIDYQAPLVEGYFIVGTEIFDDSGCPHTLEHLIFMGSEKYPYKGIIDHFANRAFSNGTNAWTDTDHTAYTASTAGDEGFLRLLPIYLDHILYPTNNNAAFVTEVHHIDPKGSDSGVVYSEMQGRESTSGDIMQLRNQRLLNPVGSGYRSETGGLMKALRELKVQQIRDYHAKYYVPHNICLIVGGALSNGTQSLLKAVQDQVEPSIIAHGQKLPAKIVRPFMDTASAKRVPIPKTIKEDVEFPEKDESMGELLISYMGPPPGEFLERKALDMLATYLTSSPVAPLNKEFIEIESPLCSYIYFDDSTRATLMDLSIYVGSVPTEHIKDFDIKLKQSLESIVEAGIDMPRMLMLINRDERQLRSKLESSSGDAFSSTVISDFLYGPQDGTELGPSMDCIEQYASLRKWSNKQWTELLTRYYIEPECLVIRGVPSAELAEKLQADEKLRMENQIKKLGPEGLIHAARVLEEAKAEHAKSIPKDILAAFPVPKVKSISWIPVQSVQEVGSDRPAKQCNKHTELSEVIESDGKPLSFFVQYDHVASDFVTVNAFFSMHNLPNRLRPYIWAYMSAFFALPVKRGDGTLLSHEEVVNLLDDETVSYQCDLGVSGVFGEMLRVTIKVETAHYEKAVVLMKDIVYGSEFDAERLQVTAAKILQSIPELKRDGGNVMQSISAGLLYDNTSTGSAVAVLQQAEFIPALIQALKDDPEKVIADFAEVRNNLTLPSGVRFSVSGNILDVKGPRSTLGKHFNSLLKSKELEPVPFSSGTLSPLGKNPSRKAVVMSLPTIESSFVTIYTKSINSYDHPDFPAIRVALEILNATEGYLWRVIRGSGLAYGASVGLDRESGLFQFSLYRSSNSSQAYAEAAQLVRNLVDEKEPLAIEDIESAKSSIVYGVASGVSTASRAAMSSFINQALKGLSQNENIEMLERYQAVTKEEILVAIKRYVLPVFDPQTSVAIVVTAPSKVTSVADDLTSAGYDVEKRTLEVEEDSDIDMEESGSDNDSGSMS